MADIAFTYMGKDMTISEEHPGAVVTVDGREFRCHHHHPPEGQGLAHWMCNEAYFASPDLRELAKHFADYGYMFDSPGRVVVDDQGEVVEKGTDPEPHHDQPPASGTGHAHGGGR